MHPRKPPTSSPRLLPVLLLLILSMATLLLLLFLSLPLSSVGITPSPSILEACHATRFQDICVATLSGAASSLGALDLTVAALSASSKSIPTAVALVRSILSSSNSNVARSNAANNCLFHLSLSSIRLSRAAAALPSSLPSARAWAAAALLYQYDCWSALKYVNSTHQVADAMSFLVSLSTLTSNAVSMIAATQRFGTVMSAWAPPSNEREGYWGDAAAGGGSVIRARGGVPTGLAPGATVCKAAGCDYPTVQRAVDAAPDNGTATGRFVIRIKAGIYEETVRVPFEKTNLIFIGDGIGQTVITASLNAKMPGLTTYDTPTVAVFGDGFMAANLTIENTAGVGAHQAVAFRSDSDLSILEMVEFLGHQDTLYARSLRQLYKSCRISGTVDFIFGNSAAVFQDCLVLVLPRLGSPEKGETNAITAHGRTDPAQPTGFVFHNCVINGSEEYMQLYYKKPLKHRNYLGRPWKEYSRTVFINCYLEAIVMPEGWLPWRGDFALGTLFYGEFNSSGPGANATARVAWSNQIPAEHVVAYSVQSFIQGDDWVPSYQ